MHCVGTNLPFARYGYSDRSAVAALIALLVTVGEYKIRPYSVVGQRCCKHPKTNVNSYTHHARERMKQIMSVARQKGEEAADRLKTAYGDLVDLTETVVQHGQVVAMVLHQQTSAAAEQVATALETMLPRLQQVINQTTRRVLEGEAVPAAEKLVSLFEVHTAFLRKGKAGKPTEFGREVWLDEAEALSLSRQRWDGTLGRLGAACP